MGATYLHGGTLMIDHTPSAAVTAGDVVVVGDEPRIAHSDIEAEQLGALAAPSGTAVYEVPKATGASEGFSDGDAVYWDATNSVASNDDDTGNRKRLGTAIADAGDNDVLTHGPERERDHHSFCLELLMRTWPLSLLLIGVIALAIAVQFPPAESAMSDAVPLDPLALAVETQVEVIRRSGSLVTFVATNGTRTELRALLGSTPIEEQSPDRRTLPATITRSTDFILPTEDLPADVTRGVALEFAGGKYQPVSLNGEPLSRDSGRHGLLTRIHTTRAVRELLDASPSDQLPGQPAGTLTIERAWLPIYRLEDQSAIVLTVLPGDDDGTTFSRRFDRETDVEVLLSVQQRLSADPTSEAGKTEIDAIVDFAERCLRAAYSRITDSEGRQYVPLRYERTMDDEALQQWNQETLRMPRRGGARLGRMSGGDSLLEIKRHFFDRSAVLSAVERTERRRMNHAGALTRKIARQSIRKRKRISNPGSPPSSHSGLLRRFIFYRYEPRTASVVAGPIRFRSRVAYVVPGTLEHGGKVKTRVSRGRRKNGQLRGRRTVLQRFRPRPFMGPALEKVAPKFLDLHKDSVS
ncbi:Uncharacterized protein SCF082_LOCUS1251 [Durusdinium trenchii]|uniref:Uncharacterized protein n=1 Tax=Durusdinium trenchii TaxID=1381693 RepID=A0ABP0HD74_9DINO